MKNGWISIEERMPEYYDLIWCSDGIGVALGTLVGMSYNPPKTIFKNKECYGCDELFDIKFWKKCKRPKI